MSLRTRRRVHPRRRAVGAFVTVFVAATAAGSLPLAAMASTEAAASGVVRFEDTDLEGPGWTQPAPTMSQGSVMVAFGPADVEAGQDAGHYLLRARVWSARSRIQLQADSARVGEYTVKDSWRVVEAVVWLDGPASTVGVAPAPMQLGAEVRAVGVDWLELSPVPWGFTTSGNQILDPHGDPTVPRGVVRSGFGNSVEGFGRGEPDIEAIHSWGASIVRLKVSPTFWLPEMCDHDATYVDRIDENVAWITSRGMIALVELRDSSWGSPCGNRTLNPLADQYGKEFWSQAAARYKDNPLVAFDLYNEPNSVDTDTWRDGGDVGYDGVGMQELYDTVRATGAQNLVFVSGTGWAWHARPHLTRPISGYGIVAATHVYWDHGDGELRPGLDENVLPVASQMPVVVTEFGHPKPDPTFNANLIEWAEANGIGWIAFNFAIGNPDGFVLVEDWDDYEPTVLGRPVYDGLRAAAQQPGAHAEPEPTPVAAEPEPEPVLEHPAPCSA